MLCNLIFKINADDTPLYDIGLDKKVSEYDQETPESHSSDQPTAS